MAAKRSGRSKKKSTSKPSRKKAAAPKKSAASKTAPSKSATKPPLTDQRVAEIQRIIDVMVDAGAVEVEMEDASGGRLRVRLKEDQPTIVASPAPFTPATSSVETPDAPGSPPAVSVSEVAAPADPEGEEFVSPMVGTFYRAASPEAELFCQVGDSVNEDSTLCVIEAMKVMNEIKAELNGRIVAILVENGEPVEFGQPLFRIQRG